MALHGCMKPLVLRLKSRDVKVQCWSVCALGNLCIENGSQNFSYLFIDVFLIYYYLFLSSIELRYTCTLPPIQTKTKRR